MGKTDRFVDDESGICIGGGNQIASAYSGSGFQPLEYNIGVVRRISLVAHTSTSVGISRHSREGGNPFFVTKTTSGFKPSRE